MMIISTTLALAAISGLLIGYPLGRFLQSRVAKEVIHDLHVDKRHLRNANKALAARIDQLVEGVTDIHLSTAKTNSGTARMVARKSLNILAGD